MVWDGVGVWGGVVSGEGFQNADTDEQTNKQTDGQTGKINRQMNRLTDHIPPLVQTKGPHSRDVFSVYPRTLNAQQTPIVH